MTRQACSTLTGVALTITLGSSAAAPPLLPRVATVAATPTRALAVDGAAISWREHLIDDPAMGGVPISGGDGLAVGDLDLDGYLDIVSVHEGDTTYDGVARGYVRIGFGTNSPERWQLVTLAEGAEVAAAEDVAIGDLNRDGFPDVVVACELGHLSYFQNPAAAVRTARWQRVIPAATRGRGSFIRVFLGDFDGNGQPEVVAANKGAQNPRIATTERRPISWFALPHDPLDGDRWAEHELTHVAIPINCHPVDIDGDGDLDVVGGSRGEFRIFWFENRGGPEIAFAEHAIEIAGTTTMPVAERPQRLKDSDRPVVTGFNFAFVDLSGDGRVDIVLAEGRSRLVWLEQPEHPEGSAAPWRLHVIGDITPDHMTGFAAVDIDGDGRLDLMTGGYSQGPRDRDGEVTADDPLGRIAWFWNPGPAASQWPRHDVSRRKRGMFDQFVARDLDGDGDVDFITTRGNSAPYDGVLWLEQVRTAEPAAAFTRAREVDSEEMPLP